MPEKRVALWMRSQRMPSHLAPMNSTTLGWRRLASIATSPRNASISCRARAEQRQTRAPPQTHAFVKLGRQLFNGHGLAATRAAKHVAERAAAQFRFAIDRVVVGLELPAAGGRATQLIAALTRLAGSERCCAYASAPSCLPCDS